MKEKKDTLQEFIHSITHHVSENVKFFFDTGLRRVQKTVYLTEKKMIQHMYAAIILLAGILFVAVGASLILSELLTISFGGGFFIIGILLIITALIFRQYVKNTLYIK